MFKLIFKAFLLLSSIQLTLFSQEINIDSLIKKAAAEHKHLFVYLHWTDCVYCQEMSTFTLDTPHIQTLIKKDFLFQDINTANNDTVKYKEFNGTTKQFNKYIGLGFPTSIFYDQNGTVANIFPGIYDENEFAVVLEYIKDNKYKKMELDEYEKSIGYKKKD